MGFCVVKYGLNQEKIINPECLSIVLLNFLRTACEYQDVVEPLDLATEDGEIIDLHSKLKENARIWLEDRATYVLVKILASEENEEVAYIPLCDNLEKIKFSIPSLSKRGKLKGHSKDKDSSQVEASNDDFSAHKKKNSISSRSAQKKK